MKPLELFTLGYEIEHSFLEISCAPNITPLYPSNITTTSIAIIISFIYFLCMYHKIAVSFLFFLNLKIIFFFFVTCFFPSVMFVEFTGIRFWCLPSFLVVYCSTVWIYYSLFFYSTIDIHLGWVSSFRQCFCRQLVQILLRQELYIIISVYNLELLGHNNSCFQLFWASTANVFSKQLYGHISISSVWNSLTLYPCLSATVGIVKFIVSWNMAQAY